VYSTLIAGGGEELGIGVETVGEEGEQKRATGTESRE
jgi:hypothetical protein